MQYFIPLDTRRSGLADYRASLSGMEVRKPLQHGFSGGEVDALSPRDHDGSVRKMRPRAIDSALAGCSGACNKQWLHVCTAFHERIRRIEMLPQFSFPDE